MWLFLFLKMICCFWKSTRILENWSGFLTIFLCDWRNIINLKNIWIWLCFSCLVFLFYFLLQAWVAWFTWLTWLSMPNCLYFLKGRFCCNYLSITIPIIYVTAQRKIAFNLILKMKTFNYRNITIFKIILGLWNIFIFQFFGGYLIRQFVGMFIIFSMWCLCWNNILF